jgi:hypothetical protein
VSYNPPGINTTQAQGAQAPQEGDWGILGMTGADRERVTGWALRGPGTMGSLGDRGQGATVTTTTGKAREQRRQHGVHKVTDGWPASH